MTVQRPHYAFYYLGLSIVATLLFTCTALNLGPVGQLTTWQSTGAIIALFTILTAIQSIGGS